MAKTGPGRVFVGFAAVTAGTVMAACGTTVRTPGATTSAGSLSAPQSQSSGISSGSETTASQPTQTLSAATGGGALPGSGVVTASTAPGPTVPSAAAPGGTTSTNAPISGWGFDARHVYVGVATSNDASTYASSVGLSFNPGNGRAQAQALIDYLNHRGGLLGRTIVPIWHDVNAASFNADPNSAVQAECADWTQDHHVFAAINVLPWPENGVACLAKAHTLAFGTDAAGPVTGAYLTRYSPYFYTPGMADTTHFVAPFVDELVREGYFAPWNTQAGAPGTAPVKIGVLYAVDRPDLLSLYQSVLARYGMHVSDSFYLQSSSDSGQLAGAMLRFKADHITHVLSDGFLSVVPTVAENAGYRPRYGVSSWDGFQVAVGAGPSAQFHGAVGVGWTPLEDLDAQHDRTKNRALTDCLSIMANAGQSTTTRSTEVSMASVCEQLLLLATSLRQATSLTPLSVQAGIESLGTGFPSPLTLGERFGPGRHAGVAAFSPVHYDVSCGCFTYFGSPQTFP